MKNALIRDDDDPRALDNARLDADWLGSEVERLTAANAALAAVVRDLQWFEDDCCPCCGGVHPAEDGSGHHPDCPLAAALALAEPPA